jgi:hypothetical protein
MVNVAMMSKQGVTDGLLYAGELRVLESENHLPSSENHCLHLQVQNWEFAIKN